MNGLRLRDGDLVIYDNLLLKQREIEMVSGIDLTAQTVQYVLSTNEGEWLFDLSEGINFSNILGKQKTISKSASANEALVKELIAKQADTNGLAEKLRRRLDGE